MNVGGSKLQWLCAVLLCSAASVAHSQSTKTAADIVPADCDFFSTSLMLREQWQGIAQSNAVKNLMRLPYVQMGLAQMKAQPQYNMAMAMLQDPQVKELVDLLDDGFSSEVFFYGEKGWPVLFQVLADYQQQNLMMTITSAMSGKQPAPLPAVIAAFTKQREFQIPSMAIGFKLADHDRATKVLARLQPLEGNPEVPGKLSTVQINGQKFYSYRLTGKDLPMTKEQFVEKLGEAEVSQYQAESFYDWLSERTFEAAIGRSGDYLILSIGSDSKLLERLNKGPSLGDSTELGPIRKHLGGKVLAIGYTSLALASMSSGSMKDSVKQVEAMAMPFKAFLPPGLGDRILGDLNEIAADMDAISTKPSASVNVTVYNRGPETFSYSKSLSYGVDFDRPLSVLSHSGSRPMLAAAGSSKSSISAYKTMVRYAKKAWGYWRDFGVPQIPAEQREVYKKAESLLLPFFAKVDSILSQQILPATDAGQSMFVIDTKLRVKSLGPEVQFEKAMPMAEFAIATTLNNGKQFKDGVAALAAAIEDLLPKLAELDPNAPGELRNFRIPRPNVREVGGGELFSYPMPPVVDQAILPHAFISDKLLILGMSPSMTERMVKQTASIEGEVVSLSKPAGSAVIMDMADFWSAVKEWIEFAAAQPGSPIAGNNAEGVMNRQHLDAGLQTLGVFKRMERRTFREGDYTVTHSWARFEDVKE